MTIQTSPEPDAKPQPGWASPATTSLHPTWAHRHHRESAISI